MWPDRVSNPGPLTYESGALPALMLSSQLDLWVHFQEHFLLKLTCNDRLYLSVCAVTSRF